VHEAATVLRSRSGSGALKRLWHLLVANRFVIIAFDQDQVLEASTAFDRYGKGIHSKARLNLCDCVAYMLAKRMNAPLLFKGGDFRHTDLQSCL
jgi:ribonuclease VapC